MLHLIAGHIYAQEKNGDKDNGQKKFADELKHIRDSLALVSPLVPAVSSIILHKDQVEIILFNSLLTANQYFDDHGNRNNGAQRASYFYSTVQAMYGVSKTDRFNVGLDLNTSFGRIDQNRNSSPFAVFGHKTTGNNYEAKAVTSFGPRFRWRPFKKTYRFTVQGGVDFPTGISTSSEGVLGLNRIYANAQLLYNQPISKRLFFFSQLTVEYGFKREYYPPVAYTPVSGFLSYYIPEKIILFALINYEPVFTKGESWSKTASTAQLGAGLQYQVSHRVLVNGYYAKNAFGTNYQFFSNYNIGMRFASK